jgi:hypothetical protein
MKKYYQFDLMLMRYTCKLSFYFSILQIIFYGISFSVDFVNKLGCIAHNVLAVYDVLPARIRACVARPGLAKCGAVSRGNGA